MVRASRQTPLRPLRPPSQRARVSVVSLRLAKFAVAKIRTLLLNVQHLLNSFRMYQAREDLIASVQAQVDAKQRLIDGLRSGVAACASAADEEDGAQGGAAEAAVGSGVGAASAGVVDDGEDVEATTAAAVEAAEAAEAEAGRARALMEGML